MLFEKVGIKNQLQQHQYGLLLVVMATLLFSTKGIFIKLVYRYDVEPSLFMFLRMLIASPVYLWVLKSEIDRGHMQGVNSRLMLATALFGCSGYYLASYLDLTGLLYLTASLERLVLYTYPSIVLILAVIFLKQELTALLLVSLAVTYCGLLLVFIEDIKASDLESSTQLLGAAFVFASAVAFSIYFVGSEVMMRSMTSRMFTALAMMFASLAIAGHYLLHYDITTVLHLPVPVYFYGVLISLVCTVLPSFLLSSGISRVGAAAGSVVGGIGPVMTLILAFIFLGESITVLQACGFLLVILGIWNLGRLKASMV